MFWSSRRFPLCPRKPTSTR